LLLLLLLQVKGIVQEKMRSES